MTSSAMARVGLRVAAVVATSLLLSACFVAGVSGLPEPGPEQVVFDVVPGPGPGAEAEEAVGRLASGEVSDAELVGSVSTPLGEMQIVTYTEEVDGVVMHCRAMLGRSGGSAGCASGGDRSGPGPTELRVGGVGVSDGWATVDLEAGDDIVRVVATAEDGTTYRSDVVEGLAMVVYPAERGALEIRGLDTSGAVVTQPVETDDVGSLP